MTNGPCMQAQRTTDFMEQGDLSQFIAIASYMPTKVAKAATSVRG